jgi:hypothetical protein
MRIVEFQVTSSAFLAALLNRIQSQQFCSPSPVAVGGYRIVVDHFEFTMGSLRYNVPYGEYVVFDQGLYGTQAQVVNAMRLQLAQPVTAVLADLNDIMANPDQPPTFTLRVDATVVMNIDYTYYGPNNGSIIEFSYASVELGPLPQLPPGISLTFIQQQIQALMQTLAPDTSIGFSLDKVVNSAEPVRNTGVSMDAAMSRVAFRAELGNGNSYSPAAWQYFYSGNFADNLQGADWSIYLDHDLWGALVAAVVQSGVEASGNGQFQVSTGFGSTYSAPSPDRVHIEVDFGGTIDATICTAWVNATVKVDITVSQENTLAADMNLSWQASTTACTITAVLLGGALGALTDLVMPFGFVLFDPILGFFAGLTTAANVQSSAEPPNLHLPNCTKISDTHYACTQTMNLQQANSLGQLTFTTLIATSNGAALTGQMQVPMLTPPSIQYSELLSLTWAPPTVPCSALGDWVIAAFLNDPSSFLTLVGVVTITDGPKGVGTLPAPLYLCSATIVNDPLGAFPPSALLQVGSESSWVDTTTYEDVLGVPFLVVDPASLLVPILLLVSSGNVSSSVPPAYLTAPYPCQVLVYTTGGIRLITFSAPPPFTQMDAEVLAAEMQQQLTLCQAAASQLNAAVNQSNSVSTNWPMWLLEDPPSGRVEHYWTFSIVGLQGSEAASLLDAEQQVLATASGGGTGAISLSAIVKPMSDGAEIGLAHVTNPGAVGAALETADAGDDGPPRTISTTQQTLLVRATLPLSQAARSIGICYFSRRRAIFCVLPNQIMVWDTTLPSRPRLLGSPIVERLRGAVAWRSGILAFGDDGFFEVAEKSVTPVGTAGREGSPVFAALVGRRVIYALGEESLEVYSLAFRRLRSVKVSGAKSLAQVGATLFVGGSAGLDLYDVDVADCPRRKTHSLHLPVEELVVPPGDGSRSLLAVSSTGLSWLLDITDGVEPKVRVQFPQPPWFYRSAHLPRLLVRLAPDSRSIVISEFGASKQT